MPAGPSSGRVPVRRGRPELAFVPGRPADGLLDELAAVAVEAAKRFRSGATPTAEVVRPAA